MAKRSNQHTQSESEPSAKRTATSNEQLVDEQTKLRQAQTAFNRLDYTTSSRICSDIIDSDTSKAVASLLLRSKALERRGQLQESLDDSERALKSSQSRKTHVRKSFALLGMALHELELAQQHPFEEDGEEEEDLSLSNTNLKMISDDLKEIKARENETPFKRLSSDLFLETMSFLDSPSLSLMAGTCKSLRSSISGSKELHRIFRMIGNSDQITEGIKLFNARSGNSIKIIDLEFKDRLYSPNQGILKNLILPSSQTLKELSISHHSELSHTIIEIASNCPSLAVLSSTHQDDPSPRFRDGSFLEIPAFWKPNFREFIWMAGGTSLVANEALLQSLVGSATVHLSSHAVRPSWLLKLMSLASNLEDIFFPFLIDEDVDEFPSMNLPRLVSLVLGQVPVSTSTQNSTPFFQSLYTPSLLDLFLRYFKFSDLRALRSESYPQNSFCKLRSQFNSDAENGKEAATSLLEVVKNWNQLTALYLYWDQAPLTFWDHLLRLLAPF